MQRATQAQKVTFAGFAANIFLSALKLYVGTAGRSGALVADAVNSLSDVVVDVIFLIGLRVANKPADASHPYGHGKAEAILAALCGFSLLFAGGGILLTGVRDIWSVLHGVPAASPESFTLIAAAFTVLLKEGLYRYTIAWGRRLNSSAVIAKAWDHRSDVFASLGVSVGIGGSLFLGKRWSVLDPVAAVVVSVFIMKSALPILKESMEELMEAALPKELVDRLTAVIESVNGVRSFHKLKTRRIGAHFAVDVHILMEGTVSLTEAHHISRNVERSIRETFGKETYITIHMEPVESSHSAVL